jgi:hypothetical protein
MKLYYGIKLNPNIVSGPQMDRTFYPFVVFSNLPLNCFGVLQYPKNKGVAEGLFRISQTFENRENRFYPRNNKV